MPGKSAPLMFQCVTGQPIGGHSKRTKRFRIIWKLKNIRIVFSNLDEQWRLTVWIKEFCEDDTANVMVCLLKTPPDLLVKLTVVYGKLCFMLKSIRCESSTIAWPELQNFRKGNDFLSCWSNCCRRMSPVILNLMDDLDEWMERDAETRQVLSVHVDFKGNRFDLKYHLFRGQWELRNANRKRSVLGRSDFIFNNDVSFRLRAVTREKISKKEAADIIRYLNISIPDNGDFYRTDVTLHNTATTGIQIDSFEAKSKVHVEANGLCFCISYLDLRQDEFRLECRLLKLETAKLDDEDNEAQVLLKKVLQMLEYKP